METRHITSLRNRNLFIHFGLAFLLLCSFGQSAYANWISIGLAGERINALQQTEAGTLFAGSDSSIFKTSDNGQNWVESNAGMGAVKVQDIASVFNIVFVATAENGIFISFNDGASWTAMNTGLSDLFVNKIVIGPTMILYAATENGGVFKSSDFGANWVAINNGLNSVNIRSLAINPTNPDLIYAGTGDGHGIFRSTNGGASWLVSNSGLISADVDPEFPSVPEIFVDPVMPGTLYIKAEYISRPTDGKFYKSFDGGGSWSYYYSYTNSVAYKDMTAMAFDPLNHTNIYLATSDAGVFKSNDSGINWSTLNSGLSNLDVHDLYFTSSMLYAGTNGDGVFVHFPVNEDISPDPFSFPDLIDVPLGVVSSTTTRTISGINVDTEITTIVNYMSNCKFSLNGGPSVSEGTVTNGDILQVHTHINYNYYNERTCKIRVGDYITSFTYTSVADDPDQFNFIDQSSSALNAIITSDPITLTGLIDSSPITISGGSYSLNGGPFRSTTYLYDLVAQDGDTITLRHTSADTFSIITHTTLTVGGVSNTFSSTTMTADTPLDTVPDAFSFTDITTGFINNTIYSSSLNITGINTLTPISVTGGEYSINLGAWISTDAFLNAGDTVRVKIISSSNFNTTVDVILTIGGISGTFSVTTNADTDGDGTGDTFDSNDDNDGYADIVDNCTLVANNQLDVDGDGYGNACDSDFNNDNTVNSLDLGVFRAAFFSTGSQQTDLNGDGFVNSLDIGLFRQQFLKQPGPSGLIP